MNFTDCEFVYDRLRREEHPVVLYGTGNGAEKLIHHLDSFGITLSGIFVSDDFVRNRSFCGHKVESFAALQERLGEVTVVLGFATDRPELLESIKELSRRVNGRLYVPEVPVFGNDIFTPRLLAEKSEDIRRLYEALADDRSRRVLEGLIRFKISGDPQELYAIETDRREAYEDIIKPQNGCVLLMRVPTTAIPPWSLLNIVPISAGYTLLNLLRLTSESCPTFPN